MVDLANQMHTAIPGSEVSTVLYAVDWSNVFDFSIMEPAVDQYIIMGYGYYYSGSGNAGPTDPLYHFGATYNYTLSKTITFYLDKGCPKNKLVLGLPYYGYEWQTTSTSIPSSTIGTGSAKTYSQVMNNASGNYSVGNHTWEGDSHTDNFTYNDGNINQCFISLDSAWRKRLEHVNRTGIAGIGIWALGYDDCYTELWDGINDYMTNCYVDPCSGTIHDFGGPTRNYYDDEDYTWTVAPENASSIDFDFTMFDVELNWDYLYVYDGPNDQSPQIAGSPFTGTTGPGQFTTSSGAVTFRFTSDGATVTPGFLANYTCNTVPAPIAGFTVSSTNICLGDSIELISTSNDANSFYWTTSSGGLSTATEDTTYLFPSVSGNYTITLEASNNIGADTTSSSLNVIVNDPVIAAASLSDNNVWIPNGIVYFTNFSQGAQSYYWNFGDGNNSTDENPWHEYANTGIYNGFLVAYSGSCPNDTIYFEVHVGGVSLSDEKNVSLNVYPNPFENTFSFNLDETPEKIQLIDLRGRDIPIMVLQKSQNQFSVSPDISSGTYFLRIYTHDQWTTLPVVKE